MENEEIEFEKGFEEGCEFEKKNEMSFCSQHEKYISKIEDCNTDRQVLNVRIQTQTEELKILNERLNSLINKLEDKLEGTSEKPGLIILLDRMKQKWKMVSTLVVILTTAMVGLMVEVFFKVKR